MVMAVLPFRTSGQSLIRIIEADSLVGGLVDSQPVQRILGNVHLRGENVEMFCDSAYQFDRRNEIWAFGNIQINTGEEQIWADSLFYFTDIDFSQLRGRVIIEADTTTLFSEAVDYRFSTKIGHFIEEVRLEDQQGVLTANSGYYYREPDSAVFRGDVQIADTLQYAEGDSLFISRRNEYYQIHGNVYVDDRENDVKIKTNYLEADSTGRRLMRGQSWLQQVDRDTIAAAQDTVDTDPALPDSLRAAAAAPTDSIQTDTTHIRAHTIESIRSVSPTDTHTVINAYQDVRIWSKKFSSISDTAHFQSEYETFQLSGNPRAWHKNIQLTGPFIMVKLKDNEIERLESYPGPFVVQQDTSIDRLNQLSGDTLIARFSSGELSTMRVFNNSHLLRYMKNDNGGPDGAIDLTAADNTLYFEDGELVKFIAGKNADGSYLEESPEVAERRLEGFSWNPGQRPKRPKETMGPRFAPVPAKPPFELPPRYRQTLSRREQDDNQQPGTDGNR